VRVKQKTIASFASPILSESYKGGKATSFRKDGIQIEQQMWADVLKMADGGLTKEQFIANSTKYQDWIDNTPYSMYM
jgi:hypothetical protein